MGNPPLVNGESSLAGENAKGVGRPAQSLIFPVMYFRMATRSSGERLRNWMPIRSGGSLRTTFERARTLGGAGPTRGLEHHPAFADVQAFRIEPFVSEQAGHGGAQGQAGVTPLLIEK